MNHYETWRTDPKNSFVIDEKVITEIVWKNNPKLVSQIIANLFKEFNSYKIIGAYSPHDVTMEHHQIQKKPTLTVLTWVPGSGKTTFSKQEQDTDEELCVIWNDQLRAMVTGVSESEINEKVWNTKVPWEWEEVISLWDISFPIIEAVKMNIIASLLSNGQDVIVDAVHPASKHRDTYDEIFADTAEIKHILLLPKNLETCIKKAAAREVRPEDEATITRLHKMISDLLAMKDSKYSFDRIIVNHYEAWWFQDITDMYKDQKDYFNPRFVSHLHNINKADPDSKHIAHVLETTMLSVLQDNHDWTHIELWAWSHPVISYPKLLQSAKKILWTDVSPVELDLATQEIEENKSHLHISKIETVHASFLEALRSVEDNSITSVGMRFCINYLKPDQMEDFFDLLDKKLISGWVFVANPWKSSWKLPWINPQSSAQFLYQDNSEPSSDSIPLRSGDRYTIKFLDENKNPVNQGTEKYWYGEEYFQTFTHTQDGSKRFDISRGNASDQDPTIVLIVKKLP